MVENLITVGKRAIFTPDDKFLWTENIVCVHSHWPSNLKQNTQQYLRSFVGGGGGKGGAGGRGCVEGWEDGGGRGKKKRSYTGC